MSKRPRSPDTDDDYGYRKRQLVARSEELGVQRSSNVGFANDEIQAGNTYSNIVAHGGPTHFGDVQNIYQRFGPTEHEQRRQKILSSLRYPEMNARRNEITVSEHATYEWLFDESYLKEWELPSFRTWLQESHGPYVIQGKPGSGKSTFMKFISEHDITRESLEQWSEENPVKVLFHSFWMEGRKLQHSMKGFLASLIYQVTEQIHLLPTTFNQAYSDKRHINDWSEQELLALLPVTLRHSNCRYCIFIDGLDEFDNTDNPEKLFDVLEYLGRQPNYKLCMSTRPIPFFTSRLEGQSTIKLHELTNHDIRSHVVRVLEQKSRCVADNEQKRLLVEKLAAEISRKADGVFMWVHYVLKTVCNGIRINEDLDTLRKRVAQLPSEISNLYRTMWQKQNLDNKVHFQDAAQIFDLHGALPTHLFRAMLLLDGTLLQEYNICMQPKDETYLERYCERFSEIIRVRSAGLIECYYKRASQHVGDIWGLHGPAGASRRPWRDMWVRFIHRSVHDFLLETEFGLSLLTSSGKEYTGNAPDEYKIIVCDLACIAEDIRPLSGSMFGDTESFWNRLPFVDDKQVQVLDLIDQTYKVLIDTRCGISQSGISWVIMLAENLYIHDYPHLQKLWMVLDFPGLIMWHHPPLSFTKYILASRGNTWSRYYKGHLVIQYIRATGFCFEHQLPATTITFLHHCGASMMLPHAVGCYNGVDHVRTPAIQILCWILQHLCPAKYHVQRCRSNLVLLLDLIHAYMVNCQEFAMCFCRVSESEQVQCRSEIFEGAGPLVFMVFSVDSTYRMLRNILANSISDEWMEVDDARLRPALRSALVSARVVEKCDGHLMFRRSTCTQSQLDLICTAMEQNDTQASEELWGGINAEDWLTDPTDEYPGLLIMRSKDTIWRPLDPEKEYGQHNWREAWVPYRLRGPMPVSSETGAMETDSVSTVSSDELMT